MTLYAGETLRVRSSALNLDAETALTAQDITASKITIFDGEGEAIIDDADMAFDEDAVDWYYDWDTSAITAGSYRAKVEITGNTFSNWEYIRIRLARNPV